MQTTILVAALGLYAAIVVATLTLPRVRYTRRGALRFIRIGRLQLSFVVCKP